MLAFDGAAVYQYYFVLTCLSICSQIRICAKLDFRGKIGARPKIEPQVHPKIVTGK